MANTKNPTFRIEPLDTSTHDRAAFYCEEEALNTYIKQRANQEVEKKVTAVYVLTPDGKTIAGYYTLSQYAVDIGEIPDTLSHKLRLPKYKMIGATLLGRLARDAKFKGSGVGELLLMHALSLSFEHSKKVGSCAVVVDAKSATAARFYESFGFIPLAGQPNRLFLPLRTIEEMLSRA